MEEWVCRRCEFTTTCKRYLISHLQRKTMCPAITENIDRNIQLQSLKNNDNKMTCEHCGNNYSHKSSLSRHTAICKGNPLNQIKDLKSEITTLKDQIEKLSIQNTSSTCNNSHNIVQQNIQHNHISINSFGRETFEHLPLEFLTSCFMFKNMPTLVENTHFDPDCPSNHNVKLQSFKAKTVKVFLDGKWNYKLADNALDEMINKGHYILSKHYRKNTVDIEEEMSEEEINEVLVWLKQIDHKETKVIAPLKNELLNMLRNYQ